MFTVKRDTSLLRNAKKYNKNNINSNMLDTIINL